MTERAPDGVPPPPAAPRAVTVVTVCETCAQEAGAAGPTPGQRLAALAESMAGAGGPVEVRRFRCLMGCDHPCNAAIAAPGKLRYVLGRLAPDEAAAGALLAFARLHAESATGQVPYRSWPEGVKGRFIARIPPLPGETP